jgi:hypothetical protein
VCVNGIVNERKSVKMFKEEFDKKFKNVEESPDLKK